MNDEIRKRVTELIKLGNDIEDKIEQVGKIESDIEKLQIYRNERGNQLLHMLMEKKVMEQTQ